MVTKCAQCGKRTVILYPDLWVYKRNERNGIKHFCSWGCLRLFDKLEKGDFKKMEQKKKDRYEIGMKCLELIGEGKSPLPYLDGLGYSNPQQAYIDAKRAVIGKNPEMADRFPKTIKGLSKQIETPEGEFVTVATKVPPTVETPEAKPEKITKPVSYDGFAVRAVQGTFGRYSFDPHTNPQGQQYLDYGNEAGDELSMTIEAWRDFLAELRKAALVLGVEL